MKSAENTPAFSAPECPSVSVGLVPPASEKLMEPEVGSTGRASNIGPAIQCRLAFCRLTASLSSRVVIDAVPVDHRPQRMPLDPLRPKSTSAAVPER